MNLREKARAVAAKCYGNKLSEIEAIVLAFGKEVAEEAIKAERATIVALQRELSDRNDRLAAFTSATPDSPEVKEAMECKGRDCVQCPTVGPCAHAEVLALALRAAQVRIKELETTSAGIFQLEAAAAQAKLAEAEKRIKELEAR